MFYGPPRADQAVPVLRLTRGVLRLLSPAQEFPVGRGVRVVRLFRQVGTDRLDQVTPDEYQTETRDGVLWVRFALPQLDFHNVPHPIWAELEQIE